MSILKKTFDIYIKTLKIFTTFLGTIAIYIIGISIGKIFYFFSPKQKHLTWSNYQPDSFHDKMF